MERATPQLFDIKFLLVAEWEFAPQRPAAPSPVLTTRDWAPLVCFAHSFALVPASFRSMRITAVCTLLR